MLRRLAARPLVIALFVMANTATGTGVFTLTGMSLSGGPRERDEEIANFLLTTLGAFMPH